LKIAVTGASGFIGGHLCAALGAAGHEVHACNVRGGTKPRDLGSTEVLVHLAAVAHTRGVDAAMLRNVNVGLPLDLGRLCAVTGMRMVFISSVKVHGEQTAAPLHEGAPFSPKDEYGESKARAEDGLRAIRGLSLTVLRPPLVYGPGVRANFLRLLRAIARGWPLPLAAIENRRSLIYVGNLVHAIIRCLHVPGTFLVSDGEAASTPRLCREMGEALGRPARLFPFPPALLPRKLAGSLEVDDSAIRALGWQAPYTRKEGLKATADWYLGR
jgi:nucleoside-diphosphate-sugar epimerase